MTCKTADIDTHAALRWLLGSALIGGGLRAGVSLASRLGAAPSVKLRGESDLYDPEIEIPVDVTPEQMKRYEELAGPVAMRKAAAWDNTTKALSAVAGGYAGWELVSALIRRRRKSELDDQLKGVQDQLAGLTTTGLPEVPSQDLKGAKLAAAWDFLDIAAERYVRYGKDPGVKLATDLMRKVAMNPGKLKGLLLLQKLRGATGGLAGAAEGAAPAARSILERLKGMPAGVLEGLKKLPGVSRVANMDPLSKVLLGGGAAVGAAPFIPGVSDAVENAGKGVASTVTGIGSSAMKPMGYGLAATLGPIAALSLLYGLHRGFSASKDRDPRLSELKGIREQIREQEIKEQPYFKLRPRLREDPGSESSPTNRKQS